MRTKLLLLMAFALMGWSNVWAYDQATEGTQYSGSNCTAYGLSDGTVAITTYYTTDGQTEVTFPATIQLWEGETMTAEYKVSAVGVSGWGSIYLGSVKTYQYNGTITSLKFSEGIETINASAFYEMTSLQSVELPASLTTIGDYAFTSCDALKSITCYGTTAPALGTDALKGLASWDAIAANCVLKVPDGCTASYAAYTFDNTQTWTYYDQFYTNNKIHELSYPSITTAGWGTYYNTYGYVMPEGVEGYIIDWTYEDKANLVKIYDAGDEVYAGMALLWKSTEELTEEKWFTVEALSSGGATAEWPTYDNNGTTGWYTNLLNGTQTKQAITAYDGSYYYYKLANDSKNGLGWYFGVEGGGVFENGAHKAYLAVNQSAGARSFIGFGDGATAIESVNKNIEINDDAYYNLHGQRVDNPTKGLYIVNGKKVIIK